MMSMETLKYLLEAYTALVFLNDSLYEHDERTASAQIYRALHSYGDEHLSAITDALSGVIKDQVIEMMDDVDPLTLTVVAQTLNDAKE